MFSVGKVLNLQGVSDSALYLIVEKGALQSNNVSIMSQIVMTSVDATSLKL